MGFLVPAFLAGLAALMVPVILHLRHRDRDEPHRFPSLMFLERLPIRTSDRRRLTDLPLLLLRALALALLVLAFARPLFARRGAAPGEGAERTVVVLLDRSLSMGYRDVWGAATDSARRVINALGPDDRAALVLFDHEAEVVQPLTGDRSLLLAALAKARPGAGSTRYAAGLRAARELAGPGAAAPTELVVVSDLQRSGLSGVAGLDLPQSVTVRTVAVTSRDRANASVGAVDAQRTAQGARQMLAIRARVASYDAAAPRRVSVMLRLNGRLSGTQLVTVPGSGDAPVAFDAVPLPNGVVRGEVTIDPDALAADDTSRFLVSTDDAVRVLLVAPDEASAEETVYLERALAVGSAPLIRVERVRPAGLDAAALRSAALVMLWDQRPPSGRGGEALAEWVARGGGLVVVAGRRLGGRDASSLLPAGVGRSADRSADRGGSLGDVRVDHPLFAPFRGTRSALHVPRFQRYSALEPSDRTDVIARFDDGSAAVVERRAGSGRVVMLSIPLDARAGDFPVQPGYLPFVRRLVTYTSGREGRPLAQTTGQSWLLPVTVAEPVVVSPGGSIVRPVRDFAGASVSLREAGFHALYDRAVRGVPAHQVAVNAPASESNLAPMTPGELMAGVTRSAGALTAADGVRVPAEVERRQGFWRLLIIAVALALLIEMFVAGRGWRGTANRLTVPTSEGSSP